jgi:hypothetical protein
LKFFSGAYYNEGKEDKDWKSLLSLKSNVKTSLIYKADIKYYFKDMNLKTPLFQEFFPRRK